jgi:hypothetical protein
VFTTARDLSLLSMSSTRSIQLTPSVRVPFRYVLMLFSHLRLRFPVESLCTFLVSPVRVTCLAHLVLSDVITVIVDGGGGGANHAVHHYAIFSTLLLLRHSEAQTSF